MNRIHHSSDFCDLKKINYPDKSFSEMELKASSCKNNPINSLKYRKNFSTTSEINISPNSRCLMKYESGSSRNFCCPCICWNALGNAIKIRSCRKDEKLFKSTMSGTIHEFRKNSACNDALKEYQDVCTKDLGLSSRKSDCYENRMFKYPYINQLSPLAPPPTPKKSTKNRSEYQDGISRTGSLIVKYKLHDHSKCGKQGDKCEHEIPNWNNVLRN